MKKKIVCWDESDQLFRRQIGILLGASGMTKEQLALRLDITEATLRNHLRNPGLVQKKQERKLSIICAENGLEYVSEFPNRGLL